MYCMYVVARTGGSQSATYCPTSAVDVTVSSLWLSVDFPASVDDGVIGSPASVDDVTSDVESVFLLPDSVISGDVLQSMLTKFTVRGAVQRKMFGFQINDIFYQSKHVD